MRIFVFVFFIMMSVNPVFAGDVRDTILIKEVKVNSYKHQYRKPFTSIDSARKAQVAMQPLHRFLQENTSIQFKTYGTSGSSVMSIRGANSSQSKVVWNGMNIGSPMLNMNDVSLLSVSSADEIELHKGGASATEGTGALAGFISLKTGSAYNSESISVAADVNHIQNQSYQVKYTKGKANFSSSTAIQLLQHKNKFKYANFSELGSPLQSQVNSTWKQFAIIQSFHYKFKNAEIEWHQWFQESDRELSPPMYNRMRSNYQFDKSYRSVLNFKKYLSPKWMFNSNIAFTREKLRYVSRVIVNNANLELFNTNSFFDQVQHKSNVVYSTRNFSQEFIYQFNFDGAYVEDYTKYVKRSRIAFASDSKLKLGNYVGVNWANRIEILKQSHYFASALNLNLLTWQQEGLEPYISLTKNYNLPGLNDMYWSPGGNPNLVAERSWEQEIGGQYQKKLTKFYTKTKLSIYNSMVRDWILWQPSAVENGLWTPQNLVQVKLQGLEFEQVLRYTFNAKNEALLNFFYAKTLALNNKPVNANDKTVGKQIIYIPEEKWGLNLQYKYFNTTINTNAHRVSHRYTSADHSNFLPAYVLVDVRLQQHFYVHKHQFTTALYVDNLLNTYYQSIPFQAMPARVFGITLNYLFKQI